MSQDVKITEERELYLYYFVFGTPEAQELMALWQNDLLNTSHFQPQIDPNNIKTIRDMAVLEFIQGIKNRVQEFIEKGVKNGPTEPVNTDESNTGNTGAGSNPHGNDTGNPSL